MNKEQQDQLEREQTLAAIGKQVIDNTAFQGAMTARKAQLFEVFCNSKFDESEKREAAWLTMQNMLHLERSLVKSLETGKLADEQIKKQQDFDAS